MGLLDDLKDKAGDLGEKAKESLASAQDKASDIVDDVKDKFDGDEETSTDKVEEALNYSPGADQDASAGINEAVERATLAAEQSAPPPDAVDSPVGVRSDDQKADFDSA